MTETEPLSVEPARAAKRTISGAAIAPPDARLFEQLERDGARLISTGKRLRELAERAKRQMKDGSVPPSELQKSVGFLVALEKELPAPLPRGFLDQLRDYVRLRESIFPAKFRELLRDSCSTTQTHIKLLENDSVGIGPFELRVDFEKEAARLLYAKTEVESGLPLIPSKLVKAAQELSQHLLSAPKDMAALASEFEEAMRVSLARSKKKWLPGSELRAELPAVYREMAYLRQATTGKGKVSGNRKYTLARFAVELKTLLQSAYNIDGDRTFIPEPAVIENSKDPRKSIFVPNDLTIGFGEGTYFQAITLRIQKADGGRHATKDGE